ncbi:MAG TPA: hypothetical protein VFU23_10030 [Gemmatimonadales bacterium]|nr:hypothetical protein [Gemmatimonadales bacterium]
MMSEKDLERRLAELRDNWRVAGEAPLDRMWERVEAEAFAPARRRPGPRWVRTWLPLAAMLVLGFGVGQVAPRLAGKGAAASPETAAQEPGGPSARNASTQEVPFVGVATDYLERVTGLLVTLAAESRDGKSLEYSATQARDLLSTTRLLMDAPQRLDPHLQALLEDLELVLAQIARLPAKPDAPDVYLIDQALDQRDVIPRLRVFLAENPTSQP